MKKFIAELPLYVKIQICALALLGVVALLTLASYPEAAKAPLLTMTGGAMVLVPLVLTGKHDLPQVATLLGMVVILLGGWFWLSDATKGNPGVTLAGPLIGALVIVAFAFMVAAFSGIFGWTTSQQNPDMRSRRKIVSRVRSQLRDLARQASSGRIVSANGVRYAQHDSDISMLCLNTWPMLGNHHQTTYDWEEHENLVENYLVERLEIIARIAVTKHPHQCKYGEIAQSMADDFKKLLQRVNIITVFDPLPAACPECGETKPTHQVNCMAAICWQCKYPTPPSRAGRENTGAVTPQCRIRQICFPRGEQLAASAPVLRRIRLPFTIPQDGSDECLSTTQWPRGKRALRDLLKQLQHEEDESLR